MIIVIIDRERTGMSGFAYSVGLLNGEGILGKDETQSIYIFTTPKVSTMNDIFFKKEKKSFFLNISNFLLILRPKTKNY